MVENVTVTRMLKGSVSLPGLSRMASGMPIFPMSCEYHAGPRAPHFGGRAIVEHPASFSALL